MGGGGGGGEAVGVKDLCLPHCVGQNNSPRGSQIPTLGIYEYVVVHGKREFAYGIKLRITRWGDYYGLSWWIQDNTRVFIKERGRQEIRGWMQRKREKSQVSTLLVSKAEEEATRPGMQVPLGREQAGRGFFQKEHSPDNTWVLDFRPSELSGSKSLLLRP